MIRNLTEYELVEKCKANDRQAQKQLYESLAPKVIGICERYVGNREEARDIIQDVFFKVFTEISKFKYQSAFSTWVIRVVINASLNHIKVRNRKYNHVDIDEAPQLFNLGEDVEEESPLVDIDTDEVVAMIKTLPDNYRLVLNMYAIEGFSHKEIAAEMNIKVEASKVLLFRARKKLMEQLQETLKKKVVPMWRGI